jgi:phosphatidylserine decarboxylase
MAVYYISLKQYDTDDSGSWSYVELYTLLDSLGATLTRATIDSFFTRFGKTPDGTLTAEEAIICLEDELTKPRSEKREVEATAGDYGASRSGTDTPLPGAGKAGLTLADNALEGGLNFTGESLTGEPADGVPPKDAKITDKTGLGSPGAPPTRASSKSNSSSALAAPARVSSHSSSSSALDAISGNEMDDATPHELERVINIKTCPLCHKKLSKKAEVDMVSHVAVCASQDWSSLDSLTVANFVSTSQAHRKWFTKMVTKLSHGSYKLGAVSVPCLNLFDMNLRLMIFCVGFCQHSRPYRHTPVVPSCRIFQPHGGYAE